MKAIAKNSKNLDAQGLFKVVRRDYTFQLSNNGSESHHVFISESLSRINSVKGLL